MTDDGRRRAHGQAWLYLCLHLAAHVAEEASTGFLDVWNPVLAGIGASLGVAVAPMAFATWLTILVLTVGALLALTPLVSRGVAWLVPGSYVLATLMIVNGAHHLLSPLYLGRFLPGAFTSPLLIASALWLIVQTRRALGDDIRVTPLTGTLVFFVAAPVTVVGWIPYALSGGWRVGPAFAGIESGRLAGAVMVVAGAGALIDCFVRFARLGRGTPAPVAPTRTLVVSGLYRHTRNPMYVAVLLAIAGQALLLGSAALLYYAAIIWLAAHAFVLLYEEPALRDQFPGYAQYRRQVPRWVPRLQAWDGPPALDAPIHG